MRKSKILGVLVVHFILLYLLAYRTNILYANGVKEAILYKNTYNTHNGKMQSINYLIILIDKETNTPVIGAVAHIGSYKFLGNNEGQIKINKTINLKDTVFIHCMSYNDAYVIMDEVVAHSPYHIKLSPKINNLGEVIIEDKKVIHSQNTIAKELDYNQLKKYFGSTFASALTQVAGVTMLQTGSTIAKPMLHGMYGNRLLIVNNGVRQQGQQWGMDHAPEIDASSAQSIKVIKGAEGLRYGSDALGGVIEIDSYALSYGHSHIHGNVTGLYCGNGRRFGNNLALSYGKNLFGGDFALRLQGTYLNGGDRETAQYVLNNTGFREQNFAVAMGWKHKDLKIESYYSFFKTQIGVLYSAQMGDKDQLKERIDIGKPQYFTAWERKIDYPYQDVLHQIAKIKATKRTYNGIITAQLAYQQDNRKEYHQRRNNRSYIPSLDLQLYNIQADINYKTYYANAWSTETGLFYNYIYNKNRPGTGIVPIIPNYVQFNGGGFVIQQYSGVKWGAELGLRLDYERLWADGYNVSEQRYGGKTSYLNFTYSIGTHYHINPKLSILSNFGLAFRTPHVHELYSDGVEHGAGIFLEGNTSLKPEKSYKWVNGINFNSKKLRVNIDAYIQYINNYIYDAPTQRTRTTIAGVFPLFEYRSANALFYGVDLDCYYNVFNRFAYKLTSSLILAQEYNTGAYLPYIPAPRLTEALIFNIGSYKHCHNIYLELNHNAVARQKRFNPNSDLINYSPNGYNLFGLGLGADLMLYKDHTIKVALSCENIFNKFYKEYTNRFRYYAHDLGRDWKFMITYEF